MSEEGPYTTIPVAEYTHMGNVIIHLRGVRQRARELLESGRPEEAKVLLAKTEDL